jgi:stage V sporulation protein B
LAASKNQNYLHGAAILTIAVVITKILGAIYKIPLANIMGPEGYAHFSVAYNLYMVLLTLSTAGLPIALAKMVSVANSLDRPNQVRRIFNVATWVFIVLGAIWTVVMFIYPTELAVFMGDVEASQSVLAMAPAVILVCVMSAFRGYTQGLSDMRPTSVSQVIEVAVKVVFGLVVLIILNSQGLSSPLLSAGAISGVAAGSLVACLYTAVVAKRRMKSEAERYEGTEAAANDIPDSRGTILKNFARIGIPIALGSCVQSVITLINTKLIYERLQNGAGFSYTDSNAMFGEYSMTLPLFNLPAAIITPLTISVVPAIAGFLAKKQFDEAKSVVESSLRIATIIALPMAVGLSVLSVPVMHGLYGKSTEQGASLLAILGAASFFVCLSLMSTAILQAGGRERLPMITLLIGGSLNIAINWYLLSRADVNIYGAPVGTLICYIIMSALNLIFLMTKMPEKPSLGKVFIKPVFNCAVMGASARLVYPAALKAIGASLDPARKEVIAALVIAIFVAVVVYMVLTIITKAVTIEDMRLIPKGEKVAKVLHIR